MKMRTLRVACLCTLGASALAIACSGSSSDVTGQGEDGGSSGSPDGSASSTDGGAGAHDGGTSGNSDAGKGAQDGGADAGPVKYGTVTLTQSYNAGTKAYAYTAYAAFGATSGPPGPSGSCTTVMDGACKVTECGPIVAVDGGAPVDAGVVTPPNAGTITLNGPVLKAPILLAVDGTGLYGVKLGSSQAFGAADTFSFDAVGGTVPAFSTTLTAPALLTVTAPVPGGNTLYSFPRDQDLVVQFTGGDAATDVNIAVTGKSAANGTVLAQCSGPSKAGTLTVPATTLGKIAAKATGGFTVSTRAQKTQLAGDYGVVLTLGASSVNSAYTATN
jgi:hypothetical protein